jgi:hypothetical protein
MSSSTIQGVSVTPGDIVFFTVNHRYDIAPKHGKFAGIVPYSVAKVHDTNLKYYAVNLINEAIADNTPIEQSLFILLETEDVGRLAFKESWLTPGSFRLYDQSYQDYRIFNVGTVERVNLLRTILLEHGFDLQRR